MFNSALSSTPSDSTGLTALAVWIFSCIIFVFVALLLYVVILVDIKTLEKRVKSNIKPYQSNEKETVKKRADFDQIFLVAHLVSFAAFVMVYFFKFLM